VKDRSLLLERLIMAQSALRRRFLDAASPTLQPEFAEWGGTTVHQMEVVRRLLLGDGMSMREVAEAEGIGLSGATQLIDRLERQGRATGGCNMLYRRSTQRISPHVSKPACAEHPRRCAPH